MEKVIPHNEKGKAVDLENSTDTEKVDDAVSLFNLAVERLKDPRCWHELSGKLTANFTPKDKNKKELFRPIIPNDFVEIDIPAPGKDWVRVKNMDLNVVKEADQSFSLTLEVAPDPEEPKKGVSHFFEEGATSTFIVKRTGTRVIVSYHGRNEIPNTEEEGLVTTVRNTAVAIGALAGLSELQWKALLKGLIEK